MASIQTGIELNDQFTSVIYGIINAVNLTISTVEDMQQTMNTEMDTSGIEGVRDEINQATMAMNELNAAMQGQTAPDVVPPVVPNTTGQVINADVNPVLPDPLVENPEPIRPEIQPNAPPEPVEIPVQWVSDNVEVFQTTGIERFQNEIESTNAMLSGLNDVQAEITRNAQNMNILPQDAVSDIQNLEGRIQELQTSIEQAEQSSLDIGSEEANAQLEQLRMQLSQLSDLQSNLNAAMQGMDIENVNNAYLQLSRNVSNVERNVRDNFSIPVEIPVIWKAESLEVFTSTGIERFQQEVQSTNSMLNRLNQTQTQIEQTASTMNILPDSAIQDINAIGERIQAVQSRITQIESNPLNMGTDTANAELEQLRSQLNNMIQQQSNLNQAIQDMDVSAANEAYLRLSQTVGNTERYIRDNVDEQGRFNQAIQEGTQQADNLMNTIKSAVGAYISIQAATKALDTSDKLVQTTSRLNIMNDGVQTTEELVNMVYAAAQNARGSFSDMVAVVAKLGNNAADAFGSSAEVVAFADLVQKQMTIAGASTTEASNAMLQLSQALGSGVLRGDELNSIFEQAPNLIQSIADYLDVGIGEIRELASEGELSADVVKAAIFSASDEINAKFNEMPMTWGQIWQQMQNTTLIAFQPVLQRLNDIANSQAFQTFVNGGIECLAVLANMVLNVFDLLASCGQFVADNWSIIEPIILGIATAFGIYTAALVAYNTVQAISNGLKALATFQESVHAAATMMATGATFAQTAAQYGLNAALTACPLTWIILLIIALIAVIFAVCSAIAKMTGVAESGFGVICGGVNVVIQFFKNLGLSVANIALGIGNAIVALASNIMTAFHNAICNVQSWWYDLLSTCLSVIESICAALNKLPFVEFDYSGISSAADDYAAKASEAAGNKEEYTSISDAFNEGMSTFDTFQDGWVSDAFHAGASWGDGVAEAVDNFSLSDLFGSTDIPNVQDYTSQLTGLTDSLDGISTDTGNISDAMEITDEDLKYLRDIAEQEAINRFTVAEINIDQSGMQNTVNNGQDLDGFMSDLTDSVNEAIDSITEGVHE